MRAQHQVVVAAAPQLEDTGVAVDDDRPPVRLAVDPLDSGNRMLGEVIERRAPVELAEEGEPQRQAAVGDEPIDLAPTSTQGSRRVAEDVAARAVELSQAAEARGERDLGDAQVGVVEQAPRKMDAGRASEPVGGDAEMEREEAA